jgi:LacI family transcriptional regulator
LPAGFAIPIVLADRIPDDEGFDLVAVDNGPAAAAVAQHLDENGFEDCLMVGTTLSISNVRERWEGAQSASKRMHIEMLEIGIDDPAGFDRLERRLRADTRPQAVFALDHVTSLLAYRLIADLGLSVPNDIAFASFDEMEWMQLVSPQVTAVRQPVEEMAEQAWALLSRQLKGAAAAPVIRRLRCAIKIRGSTPRCQYPHKSGAA